MGRKSLKAPLGGWEKALNEAIDRLLNGVPTDPHLVRQKKLGKLKVGATAAAREAGCPRDYVSHQHCRYPEIYRRIQELKHPAAAPRSLAQLNRNLRQRNKELLDSIRMARAQVAAMLLRMEKNEKEYARKVDEIERVRKRGGTDPNEIAGRTIRTPVSVKVVQMPVRSKED